MQFLADASDPSEQAAGRVFADAGHPGCGFQVVAIVTVLNDAYGKRLRDFTKALSRYDTFTLKTSGWKLNENYLTVSKVSIFKFILSCPMEGEIKTVAIHRDSCGDRWTCLSCVVDAHEYPEPTKGTVRIEVGLKYFCVDLDPECVDPDPENMVKNRHLSISIQAASWGSLF